MSDQGTIYIFKHFLKSGLEDTSLSSQIGLLHFSVAIILIY